MILPAAPLYVTAVLAGTLLLPPVVGTLLLLGAGSSDTPLPPPAPIFPRFEKPEAKAD